MGPLKPTPLSCPDKAAGQSPRAGCNHGTVVLCRPTWLTCKAPRMGRMGRMETMAVFLSAWYVPALIHCSLHFTINCAHVDPSHSRGRKRSLQEVCLTQAQSLPHYCTHSLQTSFEGHLQVFVLTLPLAPSLPKPSARPVGFCPEARKQSPPQWRDHVSSYSTPRWPLTSTSSLGRKKQTKTESLEPTGVFPSPGYIHPSPCSLIPPGRGQRQRGQAGQ